MKRSSRGAAWAKRAASATALPAPEPRRAGSLDSAQYPSPAALDDSAGEGHSPKLMRQEVLYGNVVGAQQRTPPTAA